VRVCRSLCTPEDTHLWCIAQHSTILRTACHARRRTLVCVYQLHSAAINALVMHSGFCVTASDDRQLRVWPTGFTDYLLEVWQAALGRLCTRVHMLVCMCVYVCARLPAFMLLIWLTYWPHGRWRGQARAPVHTVAGTPCTHAASTRARMCMCVCARVCVCVCVRACACACVCMRARACVCACERVLCVCTSKHTCMHVHESPDMRAWVTLWCGRSASFCSWEMHQPVGLGPLPGLHDHAYPLLARARAQAEHESGVTSVGVSPDGLRVAVGTESGALGVLDIPTHRFTPLLRSHVAAVNAVAADPVR